MEKIVSHPLYIRCKQVIESCETPEQLKNAISYCNLAKKKTSIKLTKDIRNLDEYLTHIMVWEEIVKEVKWN